MDERLDGAYAVKTAIITGGGSGIETIEDFARVAMRLPSKIPLINFDFASNQKTKKQIKDTSWFVAYGLAIWGVTNDRTGLSGGDQILARIKESFGNLVKQLLP